jgi:CMP-2-keto-3-deoxyoctulosonic acid synthetase
MPKTAIVVPCRLESTRFPRKLLHAIRGKPLVLWVAERIAAQAPEFPLWFAVDHELLRAPLAAAGFQTILTASTHQSGTDRLAEANGTVRADFVINVQADEPLVTGAQIRRLAELIAGPVAMATLATPFRTAADFANPNQVKVVVRNDGLRSVRPALRGLDHPVEQLRVLENEEGIGVASDCRGRPRGGTWTQNSVEIDGKLLVAQALRPCCR